MDIFFVLSVIGILLVAALKVVNISRGVGKEVKLYGMFGSLAGGALALVLWFFAFSLFTASITNQTVSTITGGSSGTITVVEQGNQYVGATPFMALAGMLLLACFFLTLVELIIGTGNTAIEMKAGPRADQYRP